MNKFIEAFRLVLTPLTPLHMGLGVEFDPAEYVIDEGRLYAFDQAAIKLPEALRQETLKLAESGRPESLHQIYKLWHQHKRIFKDAAHEVIPVSPGLAKKYSDSLGQAVKTAEGLDAVFNQNFLERTAFLADGRSYIPGGGFKGALRTAWLEARYKKEPGNYLIQSSRRDSQDRLDEEKLLGGDFETSPFRLLKIADFLPEGESPARRLIFARNYKKTAVQENVFGRGLTTRKEVILLGQYRAFASQSVLMKGKGDGWRPELAETARVCNEYYRARLERELEIMNNLGFLNPAWRECFQNLLKSQTERLETRKAFLLRLGRYGGAETKTIKGLAKIKIMGDRSENHYKEEATTFWLASEAEKAEKDLLPFGWVLVEIDPQEENEPLREWGRRVGNAPLRDWRRAQDEFRQRAPMGQPAPEPSAPEATPEERELAALSPEKRDLRLFQRKLEVQRPLKPSEAGAAILVECENFLNQARSWPAADRLCCAATLEPLMKDKGMFLGKREKQFKEQLKTLREPLND